MRRNSVYSTLQCGLLTAFLCASTADSPANATHYHVTVLGDDLQTNGNCTLREAMTAAVLNTPQDQCPAGTASDTITLETEGTYIFSVLGEFFTDSDESLVVKGPTAGARNATIGLGLQNRFLNFTGSGSIHLEDLTISLGVSAAGGGALRFTDGDLELANVGLAFNQAADRGGAIFWGASQASDDRELVIEGSEFVGNQVTGNQPQGGALYAEAAGTGLIRVSQSTLDSNSASSTDPSSPLALGGAVSVNARLGAVVQITDSLFIENEVVLLEAGSVDGTGLHVHLEDSAALALTDNSIVANTGNHGSSGTSAVSLSTSPDPAQILVDRNLLANNDGRQFELILNPGAQATISNTLTVGGTIGARILGGGEITISHVTSTQNDTGILMNGFPNGTASINNSIIALNGTDLNVPPEVVLLSNLVGIDPLFSGSSAGDYRLQEGSPAVDSGNLALPGGGPFDLDHGPRVVGAQTDIGAYEYAGLFEDDFETGNLSAWDSVTP